MSSGCAVVCSDRRHQWLHLFSFDPFEEDFAGFQMFQTWRFSVLGCVFAIGDRPRHSRKQTPSPLATFMWLRVNVPVRRPSGTDDSRLVCTGSKRSSSFKSGKWLLWSCFHAIAAAAGDPMGPEASSKTSRVISKALRRPRGSFHSRRRRGAAFRRHTRRLMINHRREDNEKREVGRKTQEGQNDGMDENRGKKQGREKK